MSEPTAWEEMTTKELLKHRNAMATANSGGMIEFVYFDDGYGREATQLSTAEVRGRAIKLIDEVLKARAKECKDD